MALAGDAVSGLYERGRKKIAGIGVSVLPAAAVADALADQPAMSEAAAGGADLPSMSAAGGSGCGRAIL